jgi:transcriptional regulator with XRE-family HTH domain
MESIQNLDLCGTEFVAPPDGPRVYATGMSLSVWVKAARQHGNLTQQALGDALGLSKQNVNAWEKGRHEPGFGQLVKIAQITGLQLPEEALRAGQVDQDPAGQRGGSEYSPAAQDIAGAFDALPEDTLQAIDAKQTLHQWVMYSISLLAGAPRATAPEQAPAAQTTVAHRRPTGTRL